MNYTPEIAVAIRQFLDERDWKYAFDENEGVFSLTLATQCKLGKINMLVKVGDEYFTAYAFVAIHADEGCRHAVAEFITRANYGMRNGNFELDFDDGEVRYKSFNNCMDIIPSKGIIADGLLVPALMMERYGNSLLGVMYGIMTPGEGVMLAERGE